LTHPRINGIDLLINQNITFVLPQKENCAFTDQNAALLRTDLYIHEEMHTNASYFKGLLFLSALLWWFLASQTHKSPISCWHQCQEIANCSFDSNRTIVPQYYRQNMQPKMTSTVHTSTRRRDLRTSTRQLNATATRARAWCYSRQNHTAAMLLSRLRDPVKNGPG